MSVSRVISTTQGITAKQSELANTVDSGKLSSHDSGSKVRSRSFTTRLAAAITTVLMGATAYFSYRAVRSLLLENLQGNALLEVQTSVGTLDEWLTQKKAEVSTMARTPNLQSMDWEQAGPYLISELDNSQDFYFLSMIYPNGEYYSTKVGKAVGKNLRDRAHIQAALAGQVFVSDPVNSRTLEGERIVAVTAPIPQEVNSAEDSPRGVLAGLIDVKQLSQVVGDLRYGVESYAFALNSEGMIIAHPDPERVGTLNNKTPSLLDSTATHLAAIATQMTAKEQGIEKIQLDGKPVYIAYFPLEQVDWSVALVIPKGNIESQLRSLNVIAILVALLTAAVLRVLWRVHGFEKNQLRQSKVLADAANQAKSDFLANMSHELRTPLNGILGYTQILLQSRSLDERSRHSISIIDQCGAHLLTLINDVLDLAKIEARRFELVPKEVHFPALLQGIVELFTLRAHQKGLELEYRSSKDLPVGIRVDEKRLRQVIFNLLSNAIKFTHRGKVTFIVETRPEAQLRDSQIEAVTEDTVNLHFRVEDTGVGMAADEQTKIFQPFEQVGEQQQQIQGAGLGLPISQKIIQAMGSEIQVQSQPEQGSQFWFDIQVPLSTEWSHAALNHWQGTIVGFEGDKRKILVVDDRWENRSVLVNLLKPLGFEVKEAENGITGLEALSDFQPDLVITDLLMPQMDGLTFIQKIRQDALNSVPILVSSASVTPKDQHKSLAIGGNAFLPKPIDSEDLFKYLQKFLLLEWVYAEEVAREQKTSPKSSGSSIEKDFPVPPSEVLKDLFDLAKRGNLRRISLQVEALTERDDNYHSFAKRIKKLVQNFDDQGILDFIKQLQKR